MVLSQQTRSSDIGVRRQHYKYCEWLALKMSGKYIFIDSMLRVRDCTGLAYQRPGFKSGSGAMQRFISRASTVLGFNGRGPTLTPMRTRQYYLSYAKRWIIQVQARVAEITRKGRGRCPSTFSVGQCNMPQNFSPEMRTII